MFLCTMTYRLSVFIRLQSVFILVCVSELKWYRLKNREMDKMIRKTLRVLKKNKNFEAQS